MNGITAILLAAGLSKRFGPANKLLADFNGEPMVRQVASSLCASKASRVVVVLGHQADQVKDALSGLDLETVFNPVYSDGQVSSVRAGVEEVNNEADGFMMCLADQPLLRQADYDALIDAFLEKPNQVLVPFFDDKRGNPVILPIALRDNILAGGVNVGCRSFIDAHPDLVHRLDVTSPAFRKDFDTPDTFLANQETIQK